MAEQVLTSRDGAVLTITLNRPEVFNALTRSLQLELGAALEAAADPAIRCVVLTGAGKGFCAGQDLHELDALAGSVATALEETYHPVTRRIRALEKPVICALNGVAAGAGLSLALACDLRVAAESSSLVPGFIAIGLVPDAGGTWFLHRQLGFARAFEWMCSNRRLSAHEALAWGLVSEVVADDRFAEHDGGARRRMGLAADAGRGRDQAPPRPRRDGGAGVAACARGVPAAAGGRDPRLRRGRGCISRETTREVHG